MSIGYKSSSLKNNQRILFIIYENINKIQYKVYYFFLESLLQFQEPFCQKIDIDYIDFYKISSLKTNQRILFISYENINIKCIDFLRMSVSVSGVFVS